MRSQLKKSALLLSMLFTLAACGGGGGDSDSSSPSTEEPVNQSPDITITEFNPQVRQGEPLVLHAKATDDGNIDDIQWRQISGPSLTLANTDSAYLTVTPPNSLSFIPIEYVFEVTVSDDKGSTTSERVSFTALRAMTKQQAGVLLHQSTMGPTGEEIIAASGLSELEWINAQIALPMTLHLDLLDNFPGKDEPNLHSRLDTWWKASLNAPDQLRQRVTFALSEILVVSDNNGSIRNQPEGLANYYDLLGQHAFGNYRDLLEAVTLSPIMGIYLSHLGNEKPDLEANIRPDENYAREVMQLFTIGLKELNIDGSTKLDGNGMTIPTYGQAEIEGFANVFTGWNYAQTEKWKWPEKNYLLPMEPWEEYHSTSSKQLLQGTVLPEGLSAREDLTQALDNLFNHPNVGPFIGKQLIQRLVTSNPTPQYVQRVAETFDDNGLGVRGDLSAVVKAILLDDEARQSLGAFEYVGKIREPLLRTVQLWRELEAASKTGFYLTYSLSNSHGQAPLSSPSVFNFFKPDYQPADLLSFDLVAPELQIANDAALIGQFNHQFSSLFWRIKETNNSTNENLILLSLQKHVDILENQGLDALLDYYDMLFYSNMMTADQRAILTEVQSIWAKSNLYQQVGYLLFTIMVSPDYIYQK